MSRGPGCSGWGTRREPGGRARAGAGARARGRLLGDPPPPPRLGDQKPPWPARDSPGQGFRTLETPPAVPLPELPTPAG